MKNILHFFIPHHKNNHRPHATRSHGLIAILVFTLTIQTTINTLYSTHPQVLGFATNIYLNELIDLTNQQRQNNGLSGLAHNPKLDEAARLKALHMFEEDYWAHVSPSGVDPWHWFEVVGYEYQSAGENLARDFDTSSGVVAAWMASPSHRDNILYDNFTEIGMAVVNGNLNNEDTTLVVQLFGTPIPSQTLEIEPIVEETIPPTPTFTPVPATATPTPVIVPTTVPPTPTIELAPTVIQSTNTPTTTNTPTLTATIAPEEPTPTETERSEIAIGKTQQTPPTETSSFLVSLNVLSSVKNLSSNRIFTLSILAMLIGLFSVDTFVFARKNLHRENAHRLVHVGIFVIAFIGILSGASGAIL